MTKTIDELERQELEDRLNSVEDSLHLLAEGMAEGIELVSMPRTILCEFDELVAELSKCAIKCRKICAQIEECPSEAKMEA